MKPVDQRTLRLAQVPRAGSGDVQDLQDYQDVTRETHRVDFRQIGRYHLQPVWAWLRQRASTLRVTRHLRERLTAYIGQRSRNGKYTELWPEEYQEILAVRNWMRPALRQGAVQLVELGFNRFDQVCKVGLVVRLTTSRRYLFLCLGLDAGIKTAYVTPTFKYRPVYRAKLGHNPTPAVSLRNPLKGLGPVEHIE